MSQLPDGYRVELDAYAGPMDLLLYLVRRHEIDLNDIPIAKLTDQYLRHLKVIETIDVENAGEFLVMAATLLEIKSAMIMPPPEAGEGEDSAAEGDENETSGGGASGGDPRYELVQQLLAYKRYKDAAIGLEQRFEDWHKRFIAAPAGRLKDEQADADNAPQADLELEDAHVMDLCEAFARVLDSIGQRKDHAVTYDETPISLHAVDIRDRLKRDGKMTLRRLFEGRTNRSEMIGVFLAVLEMVRDRTISVHADAESGDVELAIRADSAEPANQDEQRAWRNPDTGEVEYDWPDDDSRKRADRRARLRAKRAAGEKVSAEEEAEDAAYDSAAELEALMKDEEDAALENLNVEIREDEDEEDADDKSEHEA